jgi:non-heme chloroperoxidase
MRKRWLPPIVAVAALVLAPSPAFGTWGLQEDFAPFPTTVPTTYSHTVSSNRTVHYSTMGPSWGHPVLFQGGNLFGHAETIGLLAPYTPLLHQLGVRIISPDRVGYGHSPFDPGVTPQDVADDWVDLMDHLGYEEFSVLGNSAAGPWIDHLGVRHPSRIVRMAHLSTYELGLASLPGYCPTPAPDTWQPLFDTLLANPSIEGIQFPPADQAVIDSQPGFAGWYETTMPLGADPVNGTAIGAANDIYVACNFPITDFSGADFPVFIYHGELDLNVPIVAAETRAGQYPNVVEFRRYANAGHGTTRHLGQVIVDLSGRSRILMCHDYDTRLVFPAYVNYHLGHGDTLDICAWKGTPAEDR